MFGGRAAADAGGVPPLAGCGAQALDLVVLGGQAGQGEGAEVLQGGDGLVLLGAPRCQGGIAGPESGDLGVAGVGVAA
ncbi:MAG: hypothetical protein ACRDOK_27595 [Streptosporangiaceae bacterium]